MRGIERRLLLAGSGALLASPALVHAQGTNGVALVIGNSKYQWEASLPNAARDATDIARRLQELGLKTELVRDADRGAMKRALDKFSTASRGARLAAFYFAGHGVALRTDTYLVPVDADLDGSKAVSNLIPVTSVSAGIDGAAHRLMMFDNCRNHPADGWRQKEAELTASAAHHLEAAPTSPNTLILYSTPPGRVALDGPAGQNSPFVTALLRHLIEDTDLRMLPEKVRRDVLIATKGRQVPLDLNSYARSFAVRGAPGKAAIAGWSGLASDLSKIIELPNTVAFSQQNGLQLPPGLIAYRPPDSSSHTQKVGAFRFDNRQPGGYTSQAALVILSAEESDAAEAIVAGTLRGKAGWIFYRSNLAGDTLTFQPSEPGVHFIFTWKGADSGTITIFPPEDRPGRPVFNGRFTRLDG